MHLNNYYNKNFKEKARELRSERATKGERRLWKSILSKEQTGIRFLRQRAIDHFIVDFFAPSLGLIIEIDGNSHFLKPEYDYYRQKKLKSFGFQFIRFTEGEVINQLDLIKLTIDHAIHVLQESKTFLIIR